MKWLDRKIDDFITRIRDSDRVPLAIGPAIDPTYHRWFVIPRNRWFNIYLHNFHHDDEEHLHDHRMMNISFLLQGDYFEERFDRQPIIGAPLPRTGRRMICQHSFLIRLPSTPHRVVLRRDEHDRPMPVWSLFIGFPQIRNWGFWCERTNKAFWRPFEEYLYGVPWKGCDE